MPAQRGAMLHHPAPGVEPQQGPGQHPAHEVQGDRRKRTGGQPPDDGVARPGQWREGEQEQGGPVEASGGAGMHGVGRASWGCGIIRQERLERCGTLSLAARQSNR
ncbi:hypothetical protein D3C86_1569140 [compost metagenome]